MTFMEALNSGKPMRRAARVYWWLAPDGDDDIWTCGRAPAGLRDAPAPDFSREDYNATDWEIAP
jgi:hypothetical protein